MCDKELIDSDHGSDVDRSDNFGGVSAFDMPIIDREAWLRYNPQNKIKLYRAWTMHNDPKYGPVRINWYVTNREKALPYEYLILEYDPDLTIGIERVRKGEIKYTRDLLTQEEQMTYADYHFTEIEIVQFLEFLLHPGNDLEEFHSSEIDMPIWVRCEDDIGSGRDLSYKLIGNKMSFEVEGYAYLTGETWQPP
jgi:hypothetical protein